MKIKPLVKVAKVTSGQGAPKKSDFSEEGIPFIRAGSLEGLINGQSESDLELVKPETAKKYRLKLFPKGSILFAKSGMSATKKRVYVLGNDSYVVSHLAVLIPKTNSDSEYLKFVLQKFHPSFLIRDYAYPSITIKEIESFKIPYSEDEGNRYRIATLLSKVESLIARRKKSIAELDELLKNTFLEMFGDPVRNEKGWDESILEKCCKKIIDCPHKTPIYSDTVTGFYCIRSSDIVNGYLDLKDTKQVTADVFEDRIKRIKPQKNDILYCREGGRLGNAARILTNDEICLGQRIMLFRNNKDFESQFLWALLESVPFKQKVDSLVGGGGAPRVNIKDLKRITIVKPERALQNQFAAIVEKVEAIKEKYQTSLTDLETLYGALSQKAFKGELDLSRIPLAVDLKPKDITAGKPQVGEPALIVQDKPDQAPESREEILRQLFKTFLSGAKNTPISLDDFWPEVEEKFMGLLDEDAQPLGVPDYDRVRDWLFDMLAAGSVTQVFNEQENRMEIRAVS